MTALLKYLIITIFCVLMAFPNLINSRMWVCEPCLSQADCDAPPLIPCPYGEVRNACGKRICGEGPGRRCGGLLNAIGHCGEGMMCRNERCHGCSMETLECFP